MDPLLKKILEASGVSGYEGEISSIMKAELAKYCDNTQIDMFGNVVGIRVRAEKKSCSPRTWMR